MEGSPMVQTTHATNLRFLEKLGQSQGGARASLRLLQFLSDSSVPTLTPAMEAGLSDRVWDIRDLREAV